MIKRQHKHYSNSDILCLMAKYSLGLLIFKQFSKGFFFIFQLLLSFITEMMAINKSTGKTKYSWVFNKKSVRKTVDTETNNLTLLPFVYKDRSWCTSEAHNRAKKKIPCKHYLLDDAVVFIDHRHKKEKKTRGNYV